MRIIETIDGVHRFEDDDSDPVEWLQAHDTGECEISRPPGSQFS